MKTLAHVVFYALVPCLVFNMLITSRMTGQQFGRMALLNVLILLSMGLIARAAAVPLRLSRAELSAFLLVVMFSNSGNYGLPVVLFAFGQDALSYATAFFVTGSLLIRRKSLRSTSSWFGQVGTWVCWMVTVESSSLNEKRAPWTQ